VFIGEANTKHPYYRVITSHNEHHIRFCREFLQMLDASEPHEDVMKLYDAYSVLDGLSERTSAETVASNLAVLGQYNLKLNGYLKALYESIKGKLQNYLQEKV